MSSHSTAPGAPHPGPSAQFVARHQKINRPAPLSLKKPSPPISTYRLDTDLYNILPSTVYSPEFDEPESSPSSSSSSVHSEAESETEVETKPEAEAEGKTGIGAGTGTRIGGVQRSQTPTYVSGLFDDSETETSSSSSAATSRAESPVDRGGGFILRRNKSIRAIEVEQRLRRNSGGRNSGRNSGRRTPSTPVTPMSPSYPAPFSSSSPPRAQIPSPTRSLPLKPQPKLKQQLKPKTDPRLSTSTSSSAESPDEQDWASAPALYTRPSPALARRPSRKMKAVLGIGMAYPPLPLSRAATPSVKTPTRSGFPPITAPPPVQRYASAHAPVAVTPARVKERLKEKERERERERERVKEKADSPRRKSQEKNIPVCDNWDVTDSDSSVRRKKSPPQSQPKPKPKSQPVELKPWQPLTVKKTLAMQKGLQQHRPATTAPDEYQYEYHRKSRPFVRPQQRAGKGETLEVAFKLVTTAESVGGHHMYASQSTTDIHSPRRPRHSRGRKGARKSSSSDSSDEFAVDPPKRSPSAPVAARNLTEAFQGDSDLESILGEYVLDEYPIVFTTLPSDAPVFGDGPGLNDKAVFDIAPADFLSDAFLPPLPLPEGNRVVHPSWSELDYAAEMDKQRVERKDEIRKLAEMLDPASPAVVGFSERFGSRMISPAPISPRRISPGSSLRAAVSSPRIVPRAVTSPAAFPRVPTTAASPAPIAPITALATSPSPGVSPTTALPPPTPTQGMSPAESPGGIRPNSRWSDYSEADSVKESWRASVLNHLLPGIGSVRRKVNLKGGVAAAKEGIRKIGTTSAASGTVPGTRRGSAEELQQGVRKSTESTNSPFAPGHSQNHRSSTSSSSNNGNSNSNLVFRRMASGRSDSIVTLGKNMLTRPESRTDRPPMTLSSLSGRSNSFGGHLKQREPVFTAPPPPSTSSTPTLSMMVGATLTASSLVASSSATAASTSSPKSPSFVSPGSDEEYAGSVQGQVQGRGFKGVFERYISKDPRKKEERRRRELKRQITVIGTGPRPASGMGFI